MRLKIALLAALLALTAAPVMAQDYENVDPTGQTVTFWHQHTRERETTLLEIVDEFNQTNE